MVLMVIGGIGLIAGVAVDYSGTHLRQFGFSWLVAFMFYLSLCVGGLFLTLAHHMFDANWSVPIRRITEHLACLFWVMAILFIPIALLAKTIYPWMTHDPHTDHALHAKLPLFTMPMFYVVAALNFAIWIWISRGLRGWSLEQDRTGDARCTQKMRVYAGGGIFLFAITVTLAAIMWMKAIYHEWFSTMYAVCYFAGSVWLTLATVYLITALLKRTGPLKEIVGETQFYFIGSLLFAFTVFYAYVTFSQYFIIWNANMPEETFYYLIREKGTWWEVGMIIIFGHFFVPFLALLRIDVKLKLAFMVPLVLWAWAMHFVDMNFQIMPELHPEGFSPHWITASAMLFMGGLLAKIFIGNYFAHAPYPIKDPRLSETLGVYETPVNPIATAPRKAQ
jgi:hypothetical protein